jgi:hypothetical protein
VPRPSKQATCHPDRKHLAKGLCKQCYDNRYSATHREALNARARAWNRNNPERRRATQRKYLYGIDAATYEARLAVHDGLCKICQKRPATHLDHNHKTNEPRSPLCSCCNQALGLFGEDPEVMSRAIRYLELWG